MLSDHDPIKWIEDNLCLHNKDHKLAPLVLNGFQKQLLVDILACKKVTVRPDRFTGKSVALAVVAVYYMMFRTEKHQKIIKLCTPNAQLKRMSYALIYNFINQLDIISPVIYKTTMDHSFETENALVKLVVYDPCKLKGLRKDTLIMFDEVITNEPELQYFDQYVVLTS